MTRLRAWWRAWKERKRELSERKWRLIFEVVEKLLGVIAQLMRSSVPAVYVHSCPQLYVALGSCQVAMLRSHLHSLDLANSTLLHAL